MQQVTIKKRLALTGSGLFAAALSVVPLAGTASAAAPAGSVGDNDAVNVQTEYNCGAHTLTAEVKNKLSSDISPTVAFAKTTPEDPGKPPTGGDNHLPIKPGESQTYLYNFSGNNQMIPVSVGVDGYTPVEVNPTANCQEPVSFRVTDFSEKTVVGYLTNNNSQYPQSVTLTAGINGQRQDVSLAPGQSVLVSVPFTGYPEQMGVSVLVTNGPNFESSYFVDLTQPSPPEVPPVAPVAQ
jgi:hypothetical protein